MRLIDADALTIANVDLENYCNVVDIALAVIKSVRDAPTVDVENFVRYHMDEISRTISYQLVEVDTHKPHCPNCGEKMEKDGEAPTIDPESLRPQGRCRYCSKDDGSGLQWDFDDIEVSVTLRCGVLTISNQYGDEAEMPINYCPICGAKMKKEDDA